MSSVRVVKYPWHIGHDYELFKLPVDWSLIIDTSRMWGWKQRPLPDHVKLISSAEASENDLMILHVDQWITEEIEKRNLFETWRDQFPGKKVVLCHGCNMADGCSKEELQGLIGDLPTVMNSPTANRLWELEDSRFILHGFGPEEWPETDYSSNQVVVVQAFQNKRHTAFRNVEAVEQTEAAGVDLMWIGRDRKFARFTDYRDFLAKHSIFFNPSFASPNPRTRAEAMLCGLAVVTTNSHGEDAYIRNGENGFCSNDLEELIDYLKKLQADPALARKLGEAGRKTAHETFHIDRFRKEWGEVISAVMEGRPIASSKPA